MYFPSVAAALEGVYGAFVNTDGGTVGDQKEIYAGMRIFELAKAAGTLKHYVWSGTNYTLKVRYTILSALSRLTSSKSLVDMIPSITWSIAMRKHE